MTTESNQSELRWYHVRRTRSTREYAGGLVGGFGLGSIVMTYLFSKKIVDANSNFPFEIWVLGFMLIAFGSMLAFAAQGQTKVDSE